MELYMIKPFKIVNTVLETTDTTGVTFEVSKIKQISANVQEKETLTSYISVPAGVDIDTYIFNELQKAGWF